MNITARVTLTIEIANNGSWSKDVLPEQVRDQAIQAATGKLRQILENNSGRIIGEPKVTAVFVDL